MESNDKGEELFQEFFCGLKAANLFRNIMFQQGVAVIFSILLFQDPLLIIVAFIATEFDLHKIRRTSSKKENSVKESLLKMALGNNHNKVIYYSFFTITVITYIIFFLKSFNLGNALFQITAFWVARLIHNFIFRDINRRYS